MMPAGAAAPWPAVAGAAIENPNANSSKPTIDVGNFA
jgi:hypothetical protein